MLRYYVYFYFCSASIIAYIGFLKLRFAAEDSSGLLKAFASTAEATEAGSTGKARMVKRYGGDVRLMGQVELSRMMKDFRRVYRATKLRKLRMLGPSLLDLKAPTLKNGPVPEEPSGAKKRKKRQTETGKQTDRGKRRRRRMKKMRSRLRRSKKVKTTLAPVHGAGNDIFQADPNAFFERDEESEIKEGIANQLFVEHWPRTIAYFILLQIIIAAVLFFGFFIYGYYKYEVWKFKEGRFYEHLKGVFSLFHDPKTGGSDKAEAFNEKVEDMADKADEADEKREKAIEKKMDKRDRHKRLQKTALRNVKLIRKEREKRKTEDKKKKGKKDTEKEKEEEKEEASEKDEGETENEAAQLIPAQEQVYDPYAAYAAAYGGYPNYYPVPGQPQ